jgi:hypothetical protein
MMRPRDDRAFQLFNDNLYSALGPPNVVFQIQSRSPVRSVDPSIGARPSPSIDRHRPSVLPSVRPFRPFRRLRSIVRGIANERRGVRNAIKMTCPRLTVFIRLAKSKLVLLVPSAGWRAT